MLETTVSELQKILNDVIETNPCSGQCKDCDYWDSDGRIKIEGWGYCKNSITEDDNPVQPSSIALAIGYLGDDAVLITSPHFGCVQFQRRST